MGGDADSEGCVLLAQSSCGEPERCSQHHALGFLRVGVREVKGLMAVPAPCPIDKDRCAAVHIHQSTVGLEGRVARAWLTKFVRQGA